MASREKIKTQGKTSEMDSEEKKTNLDNNVVDNVKHFLSSSQVSMLLELGTEEVHKKMQEILQIYNPHTCLKEAALLDYYVSGFLWAKEVNLPSQKISSFMTILHMLLDNIKNKHMSLVDNIKELAIALKGTEKSISTSYELDDIFTVEEAVYIVDYFKYSLFQHYRLYEFLFHHSRKEMVFSNEENIEIFKIPHSLYPLPLEEGMSQDKCNLLQGVGEEKQLADEER
ncbi:ciliary-associated calcium-binding coiled-coil protein 1 isoform X1 [Erpetoichthys calabaricus]|uniref:ciliary-associated calcium-binding coiled-coil protein 1 isoform X1 n=1 Tax=Erpetoichthys calabaricus TaxID=27687 RepID=UPI0010A0A166|nr:ciliary-associated calcium-binding coiled-coil protein 1 isoform X1 [Erpetoichthys calabaricus]